MVIWTNEIPTILHFSEQDGKQQEKRINIIEKQFQLKLVKWFKKNAISRSHLGKINEKIR